jgi:hypothetical protein
MPYSDKNILLTFITYIHMFVWIIMIYVTLYYPKFSILYLLPIWYLTYVILDECIFDILENNLGKKPEETNPLHRFSINLFNFSYEKPITPLGLIVLGFIIGVYSLKLQKL